MPGGGIILRPHFLLDFLIRVGNGKQEARAPTLRSLGAFWLLWCRLLNPTFWEIIVSGFVDLVEQNHGVSAGPPKRERESCQLVVLLLFFLCKVWERRWPFRHHPDFAVAVDPCLRLRTFLAVPGSPVSTVGHRQKLEPLWFSRSVKMSWEIGLRRWSLEHTPDSPRLGGGGVTAR
nr:unnamed protein product [Rangifer tarandus platyrhynchus]